MEIEKLISEYNVAQNRATNTRNAELNLARELIVALKQQQTEYEELKKAKRPVIGPAETKKRIEELEQENARLLDELRIREGAIISLQTMVQETPAPSKKRSFASLFKK